MLDATWQFEVDAREEDKEISFFSFFPSDLDPPTP